MPVQSIICSKNNALSETRCLRMQILFFLQLTLSVKKRTLGEKRKAKMRPEILMLCSKVIQIMKTPNTIHLIVVHMSRKSLPGIV